MRAASGRPYSCSFLEHGDGGDRAGNSLERRSRFRDMAFEDRIALGILGQQHRHMGVDESALRDGDQRAESARGDEGPDEREGKIFERGRRRVGLHGAISVVCVFLRKNLPGKKQPS